MNGPVAWKRCGVKLAYDKLDSKLFFFLMTMVLKWFKITNFYSYY